MPCKPLTLEEKKTIVSLKGYFDLEERDDSLEQSTPTYYNVSFASATEKSIIEYSILSVILFSDRTNLFGVKKRCIIK